MNCPSCPCAGGGTRPTHMHTHRVMMRVTTQRPTGNTKIGHQWRMDDGWFGVRMCNGAKQEIVLNME